MDLTRCRRRFRVECKGSRRIATDYKVFFEKVALPGGGYAIDHTPYTFLLDREGRFSILFPPGTPAGRMVAMLREQLAAAGTIRPRS